jgi:hypothetical protein
VSRGEALPKSFLEVEYEVPVFGMKYNLSRLQTIHHLPPLKPFSFLKQSPKVSQPMTQLGGAQSLQTRTDWAAKKL